MSSPLFTSDILFAQRLLACSGLYHGKLDGVFGPMTHAAEDAFDALTADTARHYGSFDGRSEAVIATLVPKAQVMARRFLIAAKPFRLTVKLLSGTRTYKEQDALFAQRPKVTNARGGQSNHNFGIAWDVGIFGPTGYYTGKTAAEDRAYSELSKLVMPALAPLGLEWGGAWRSIVDKPHYQLATGKSVTQVCALLEAGRPYV